MKTTLALISSLIIGNSYAATEIANARLDDIAVATTVKGQPTIVYNPVHCREIGHLVCTFIRTHEQGHIKLGHILTEVKPAEADREADCWAAQNARLEEVHAAYLHFLNQGYMGQWKHGSAKDRARHIAACAGISS